MKKPTCINCYVAVCIRSIFYLRLHFKPFKVKALARIICSLQYFLRNCSCNHLILFHSDIPCILRIKTSLTWFGSLILCSSHFMFWLLPQLPHKLLLTSKVVKSDQWPENNHFVSFTKIKSKYTLYKSKDKCPNSFSS